MPARASLACLVRKETEGYFPPRADLVLTPLQSGEASMLTHCFSWLPFLDTYRTMCIAPSPDFLQALEGISALRVAA